MSSRLQYLLWLLSILLVVTGSLLPATSPVMRAVGKVPVGAKALHSCAYTWLALPALLVIRRRPVAVLAALAMIVLGGRWSLARNWCRAENSKSATCSSTDSGA